MKFFGVIVLLTVAASTQAMPDVRSKRTAIDDNLISIVEKIKEAMKTGNEDLDIPILDPLFVSILNFTIDQSMLNLDASLSNMNVKGLSDFTVDLLTYSENDLTLNFTFPWSSITIDTEYDIDGIVLESLAFFGKGDLNVLVKNLLVSGSVTLSSSIRDGNLYIVSMTTAISVGEFKAEGTGFMDDDAASDLVSLIVTETLPLLLEEYQEEVTTTVSKIVVELANRYLANVTLDEFLDIIRG